MPANFLSYTAEALSPTVLQGARGERLAGAFALMFDTLAETANEAVKARFLGSNTHPVDALPLIGQERMLPRYPVDSDASYRARLRDAWNAWTKAGTDVGIVAQLAAMGLTAYVREQNIDWDWDGDTANWSRFWVVITGHPWSRWKWGDGHTWGGGQSWGSSATVAEVRSVRALVRKWKPARSVCPYIIVVMEADDWALQQPDGSWADPANRSAAAIYWRGTAGDRALPGELGSSGMPIV
jgi:hypothetical protein